MERVTRSVNHSGDLGSSIWSVIKNCSSSIVSPLADHMAGTEKTGAVLRSQAWDVEGVRARDVEPRHL